MQLHWGTFAGNQKKGETTQYCAVGHRVGGSRTWHPGHALYCLWRFVRRRWLHTRDWTATWRFHLDGRQQVKAIPQRERTAETPTAMKLCPVFAIHQIWALAMGRQLQAAIGTETEAQGAHAALLHEILSALRSAFVRRVGNPSGPRITASRNREHTLMNRRGTTVGTTLPCPTRHTRALPTAAGHRHCSEDAPPRTRSAHPAPATCK